MSYPLQLGLSHFIRIAVYNLLVYANHLLFILLETDIAMLNLWKPSIFMNLSIICEGDWHYNLCVIIFIIELLPVRTCVLTDIKTVGNVSSRMCVV